MWGSCLAAARLAAAMGVSLAGLQNEAPSRKSNGVGRMGTAPQPRAQGTERKRQKTGDGSCSAWVGLAKPSPALLLPLQGTRLPAPSHLCFLVWPLLVSSGACEQP